MNADEYKKLQELENIEIFISNKLTDYIKESELKDDKARNISSFLGMLWQPRLSFRNLYLSSQKREFALQFKDHLASRMADQGIIPRILEKLPDEDDSKILSMVQNELYRLYAVLLDLEKGITNDDYLNSSSWLPWRWGYRGQLHQALTECKARVIEAIDEDEDAVRQCCANFLLAKKTQKNAL